MLCVCAAGGNGLIPAHAGSTDVPAAEEVFARAHPRSRGEHSKREGKENTKMGSSPLTRGAQARR